MDEILEYCSMTWGVTLPDLRQGPGERRQGRAALQGARRRPRTSRARRAAILWNFEKFVLTPDGEVHRFRPQMKPDDPAIVAVIEANLPR